MAGDAFEPFDEPFPDDGGTDERAEKLLDESDGNEDPDSDS
jgi:hypothetical protein